MTMLDPRAIAEMALPLFGGTAPSHNSGIVNSGDVLINRLNDGTDLNSVWQEMLDAFAVVNAERTAMVSLMSHWTTEPASVVPQNAAGPSFEKATELGQPRAALPTVNVMLLGSTLLDFDLRYATNWKFLRDCSAEQFRAIVNSTLESDNRLVTGTIFNRLFNTHQEINEWNHPCFSLWSGDGIAPPSYMGQSWDGTHSHYLNTATANLEPDDLEAAIDTIVSHGYGTRETNSQLLIFANQTESREIQLFNVIHNYGTDQDPKYARYSFIPSVAAPPYLLSDAIIVGNPAPATYGGLNILGSYGPAYLIETHFVPEGYIAVVATNGPDSQLNPISVRQHIHPEYQGLRQIPGNNQSYPIVDSYSLRTFGVGTRHRGAAAVIKVGTGAYTAPPKSAFGL